jgi:hypothetical protein
MRFLLLSLLMTLSTGAFSAEYSALEEKLIAGRCRMNSCWWFSIENAQMMGASKAGELFAISTKRWSASCPQSKCGRRSFDGTATSFIFCSRTHPAWIGKQDDDPNKWTFQLLGPGSPDAAAGVWEGVHVMYWAACHALDVGDPFDAKLGQRYGYPTALPKFHEDSDAFGKEFSNPFDILKFDNALGSQ